MFLSNNIVALKEGIRLGKSNILKNIDEKTLLARDENGVLMLDYLLDNVPAKDTFIVVTRIKTNGNLIKKVIEKDIGLLPYLDEDLLVESTIDGQVAIEYLFQKDLVSEKVVKKISDIKIYVINL